MAQHQPPSVTVAAGQKNSLFTLRQAGREIENLPEVPPAEFE